MKSNPFSAEYEGVEEDSLLVAATLAGDASALDALVRRHQPWLYNLALRMVWDPADAEDLTQEVLVRLVTKLATFRNESSFRTWAYRLATNHALSFRRTRVEHAIKDFEAYARCLEDMPSSDSPEAPLLVQEARLGCMIGMLLCLDREQRITFLLGEVFGASDSLGAEMLGISPDNYRQRLSRARRQLRSFLQGHCGLADPANPCRCARKTRAFIAAGIVDPERLRFDRRYCDAVSGAASHSADALTALSDELNDLRVLLEPPDFASRLRSVLGNQDVRRALRLA